MNDISDVAVHFKKMQETQDLGFSFDPVKCMSGPQQLLATAFKFNHQLESAVIERYTDEYFFESVQK